MCAINIKGTKEEMAKTLESVQDELEQHKTDLETATEEVELLTSLPKSEGKLRKDREDELGKLHKELLQVEKTSQVVSRKANTYLCSLVIQIMWMTGWLRLDP